MGGWLKTADFQWNDPVKLFHTTGFERINDNNSSYWVPVVKNFR